MIVLICMMSIFAFAQKPVVIDGTVDKIVYKKVFLYKVLNGRLVEIATATPDSSDRFSFKFTPEYEGLYAVGSHEHGSLRNVFKFYFKGGETLQLALEKSDYKLIGTASPENSKMDDWYRTSYHLLDKAVYWTKISTFVDFFPEVEEMNEKIKSLKMAKGTGNKKFDEFYPTLLDFDLNYFAVGFLFTPRTAHPSKDEYSDYYLNMNVDDYLNDKLLLFPYGDRLTANLVFRKVDLSKGPSLDEQIAAIPSDVIKGQYALIRMAGSKTFADYSAAHDKYQQYFLLQDQKDRSQAIALSLANIKAGAPSIGFSFPDVNGKVVSLSDLKGKLVLIDVWATWCGPCKAEEPHWDKMVEQYKDKAIAFVGLSTDKDKAAWEKYVVEKNLKGIQLHGGPGNDISKAYSITGIPQYILLDKQGNIITPDGPRPSQAELKALIDISLGK